MDPQVAFDKVAQYDKTEDLVLFLMEEGIRGYRRIPDACPLARWLERSTGAPWWVNSVMARGYPDEERRIDFPLTPVMATFVKSFDRGRWQCLSVTQ